MFTSSEPLEEPSIWGPQRKLKSEEEQIFGCPYNRPSVFLHVSFNWSAWVSFKYLCLENVSQEVPVNLELHYGGQDLG